MRRLTLKEVNEQHSGKLPPDAMFRADDQEAAQAAAAFAGPETRPRCIGARARFAVLNAFTDCALAGLTGAETKVWLILFRDTKAATGTARTGQADIARRAGLSRRGVQVALDKLTAKGLVTVVRRGRLNAGPSTYRVHAVGIHEQTVRF